MVMEKYIIIIIYRVRVYTTAFTLNQWSTHAKEGWRTKCYHQGTMAEECTEESHLKTEHRT